MSIGEEVSGNRCASSAAGRSQPTPCHTPALQRKTEKGRGRQKKTQKKHTTKPKLNIIITLSF